MERLLTGLAARTGQGPFVADQTGAYHLRIDGHSLFLARQGADLIVHSPLDWQARADAAGQREVLRDALEQRVDEVVGFAQAQRQAHVDMRWQPRQYVIDRLLDRTQLHHLILPYIP